MATVRKVVFRDNEIYHIFNRGIERRPVFTDKREYDRALKLIKFYKHADPPIRYSKILQLSEEVRKKMLDDVYKSEKLVDILAFCLMPNHFHFLLKQKKEKGITTFISNFTNAYTKYFNTKNNRIGPLFQGTFKAVLVESDEQLMHLSRYIHLNPVVSSIIKEANLNFYPWSSYPEYFDSSSQGISVAELVLSMFKSIKDYQEFVENQIDYGKKLDLIKHLLLE